MGQEKKGLGRKASRRKAAVPLRRSDAKTKTQGPSKSHLVRADADRNQNAEVARLASELSEALKRQTATSDILKVIASSPSNVQPVFEAMLDKAISLCGAKFGSLFLYNGNGFSLAADRNLPRDYVKAVRGRSFSPEVNAGFRFLVEKKSTLHVKDMFADTAYARGEAVRKAAVELGGVRSLIAVPLLKKGKLIGNFSIYKKDPGGFAGNQVALVENFANQAVIAIENARLFNETKEALERQTATSEILKVIAGSPSDVQPVFDAIVERAVSLCGARFGRVYRYDGKLIHLVGDHGLSTPGRGSVQRTFPRSASDDTIVGRVMLSRKAIIVADLDEDHKVPPLSRQMISSIGARSQVTMPMLLKGEPIGAITLGWTEPRGYNDQQIALLQTFADQAAIAIENARLFNETKEALERQTATAEILRVIASSPSEVQPVFEAIATTANRLIGGFSTAVCRVIADVVHLVAFTPTNPESDAALKAAFPLHRSELPHIPLIQNGETVQIADSESADPQTRRLGRTRGWRSIAFTPLMYQDASIGFIACTRRETGVLAEHHLQLLRTFADQAVIAIENARLFNEVQAKTRDLQESLQQQTATADVLKVISRSAFDLQTVLQTLVESAAELCEADFANIWRPEGSAYRLAASFGIPGKNKERLENAKYLGKIAMEPGRGSIVGRVLLEKRTVQVDDVQADPEYELNEIIRIGDYRTVLGVPLLREGVPIGVIFLSRCTVRPFTDKHIELVTTFADQAVIAIENVRLFDEVQAKTRDLSESLQHQTATAEVLKVISRSAFDLQTVLDTLVESAVTLSGARTGTIFQKRGDLYHLTADYGYSPEMREYGRAHPLAPGMDSNVGRTALTAAVVQIPDVLADLHWKAHGYQRVGHFRAMLGIPIVREGKVEGVFSLAKPETGMFGARQVELVQTFADQASIAIENARLFDEVQARTRDLSESLQHQTATSQILNVISSSRADIQPAFNAIVGSAARLFEPCAATITTLDDDGQLYWNATAATLPDFDIERAKSIYPIPAEPERAPSARALLERRIIEIPDITAPDTPEFTRKAAAAGGFQSVTFVPLIKQDQGIGTIILTHSRAGFKLSEKQLALVRTFADQAVIAIENARLFEEVQARTRDLEESLQQQTATAEVLKVITRSTFNLQTVLDTLVESATRLCDAQDALIFLPEGNIYRAAARYGFTPEYHRYIGSNPIGIDRGSVVGRTVIDKQLVHISDVLTDPYYTRFDAQKIAGYRAVLGAPMLREGNVVGVIFLTRTRPEPFTEKQIELVKTFADQAIIAIENTRLFDEVQAKTRDLEESLQQQTATAEVLKTISRSTFDLPAVLNALVKTAAQLCDADKGTITRQKDGAFYRAESCGFSEEFMNYVRDVPVVVDRHTATGRALLEGVVVHIPDVEKDLDYNFGQGQRLGDYRSLLGVPMLREGVPIGVIALTRTEPRGFTDKQIELATTFADQAAIAIQNVRLFNETKEALERQTATAEILQVIASSPSDVQPVFDAIATRANSLVGGFSSTVFRFIDGMAHLKALTPTTPEADEVLKSTFPRPVADFQPFQMAQAGKVTQIPDTEAPTYELKEIARARGYRSMLFAPLMNKGVSIGFIAVTRVQPGNFAEHHVQLLRTFADQAVIAIENARLFDEVQARTRELAKSLDDLRAAQDRLVQTEKLASLGQLTAGIAHEIKNPLNFVNNFSALSAELVDEMDGVLEEARLEDEKRGELDEIRKLLKSNLEKVVQHGKRADSIVKNMLLHSRSGSGERRPVEINAIIDESLNLAYHGARAEKQGFNITLERDFDPSAGIADVYPQEITRVLLNLVSNGFYAATKRATEAGNGFEPRLKAATKSLGDMVEIRIRDNGMGIPPDIREKIFNPFFTTKPAGEGTGLGLSMSHDIVVKQHGGTIDIATEPGAFTEFIIKLPRTMIQPGAGEPKN